MACIILARPLTIKKNWVLRMHFDVVCFDETTLFIKELISESLWATLMIWSNEIILLGWLLLTHGIVLLVHVCTYIFLPNNRVFIIVIKRMPVLLPHLLNGQPLNHSSFTIKADWECWAALEWGDPNTKSLLMPFYKEKLYFLIGWVMSNSSKFFHTSFV